MKRVIEGEPVELYQAIGKLTSTWSHFEYAMNEAIWKIADVPPDVGACMTYQIFSTASKLKALISLVAHRGGDPKALNKFFRTVISLQEQRNRIIHDPWWANPYTGQFYRLHITVDRELKSGNVEVPLSTIAELILDIERAQSDFCLLVRNVVASLTEWKPVQPDEAQAMFRRFQAP